VDVVPGSLDIVVGSTDDGSTVAVVVIKAGGV